MEKFLAVLFLILGEVLTVYSQIIAAETVKDHENLSSSQSNVLTSILFEEPLRSTFWKSSFLLAIAGALLIAGYMIGYKSFKNIWIVMALSITSILILEPILAYITFKTIPSKGALAGLILGALGFAISFL